MGETTSKTSDRLARARAAVIEIARRAAETGQTAVLWGYCLAVEVTSGAGGWVKLPGAQRPVAHGRRAFAEMIAQADELGTTGIVRVLDAMAEHYERSMPNDVDPALFADVEQDMRGTVTDEQLAGKGIFGAGEPTPDPVFELGDIVQIPEGKVGVVESLEQQRVAKSLVAVECGDTRGPFRASTLRHVPQAAIDAVEPLRFKREALPAEYVLAAIGRCHAGNALTGRALAAYHRGQYRIALTYAVAQQIEQVRQVVHRCVNPWHGSAPSRELIECTECYEPHPTAEQVTRPDGVVFAVGDVVTWTKGPDTQTQWRVDTLYVPRATGAGEQREPFAGMSAVVQPKYGTRGTAGRLSLLRHVERPGVTIPYQAIDLLRRVGELIAEQAEPESTPVAVERIVRRAQYDALRTMLDVLNGWASGARENHEALGHRGENVGEECWRNFHHEDIVRMVADAANELGTLDPTKAVASDV